MLMTWKASTERGRTAREKGPCSCSGAYGSLWAGRMGIIDPEIHTVPQPLILMKLSLTGQVAALIAVFHLCRSAETFRIPNPTSPENLVLVAMDIEGEVIVGPEGGM